MYRRWSQWAETADGTKNDIIEDDKNSEEEGQPNHQQKGIFYEATPKPTVNNNHLNIPMEKEILKNLLVIFGQRKTKRQNLFYREVICHLQLDVKLHVTLFTAVSVAYYLTQMQKVLLHLMIICIYLWWVNHGRNC